MYKRQERLSEEAVKDDSLYLIPAFSGLGAPYWDSHASAAIVGMTRTTGKAEIVRAGVECIAYQITDIVKAMSEDCLLYTSGMHRLSRMQLTKLTLLKQQLDRAMI